MLGEMGFAKTGLVPSSASGGKLCRLEYHSFVTFIIERFGRAQFLNGLRGRVEWGAELPQLQSITAAELGFDAFGYSKVLLWLEDQAQNSLKCREWAFFFSTSVSCRCNICSSLQLMLYIVPMYNRTIAHLLIVGDYVHLNSVDCFCWWPRHHWWIAELGGVVAVRVTQDVPLPHLSQDPPWIWCQQATMQHPPSLGIVAWIFASAHLFLLKK